MNDKIDKVKLAIVAGCIFGMPNSGFSSELLNSVGSIQAPLAVSNTHNKSNLPIAKPVIIPSESFAKVQFVTFASVASKVASNVRSQKPEALSADDYDSMDSGITSIAKNSDTNSDVNSGEASIDGSVLKSALTPVDESEIRIAKLQIILDRAGVSPGAINGQTSEYLSHALSVFSEKKETLIKLEDKEAIDDLIHTDSNELFSVYEITKKDIAGPFVAKIPERIQDQGSLKALTFGSVEEKLAETFHMDEAFLLRLNPDADFSKVGTKLRVANIGRNLSTKIVSIKANMNLRHLSAYGANGKIIAVYPASIGSPQNPSPRGTFKVRNKAGFPKYTLSPSNTFEPIDDGLPVIVASGPNNPVGIAWIGLSKKSYGIHGTPWPSRVGEAGSHGCIRLTNWDAMELAKLVSTGIKVIIE